MIKSPGCAIAAIFVELVAKPIPKTIASSTPKKLATVFSSSFTIRVVPNSLLQEAVPIPYLFIVSVMVSFVESEAVGSMSANPK